MTDTQTTRSTLSSAANQRPAASVLATLVGGLAILLWALLALFTAASGSVPPFQLTAMTFGIAGAAGLALAPFRPGSLASWRQPWPVWLTGVGGLFGYHFFYFTALQNAPTVDASLIAYLWPLFIVLFSALLPGERLGWHHVLGALLGLAGAFWIVTKGQGLSFDRQYALGYAAAGVCALTWSSYSVLSRRFAKVPSDIITGFCLVAAVLALACHLSLEQTRWPESLGQWLSLIALGLGPIGLSFFVWDFGVKRGDIQVLGAASYATPLLSTLVLIAFGFAEPSWAVAGASLLITGGAVLAAKNMLFARRRQTTSASA